MKNKKTITALVVVLLFGLAVFLIKKNLKIENINNKLLNIPISEGIEVVPTMNDKISADTAWCGTFQLVWNDMINELIKQDVKFIDEESEMVENLNKQDFNENSISEEYYFKKFGRKTLDLKKEIEDGIKEKFNETSDVLEDLDWSEDALDKNIPGESRYIFYTMLKREFSYEKEFTKLKKDNFANKYKNIKYFGIDDSSEEKLRNQVDVLYYDSEESCAVTLNTVEGDKVTLCKGIEGSTFNDIYNNLIEKSENYNGTKSFEDIDYLKIPEISFNIKKEYTELQNKFFEEADGDIATIEKTIQTIQMNMDEKGGSIKSEAVIDMVESMAMISDVKKEPRYFYFNDKYIIFITEQGKEKPYFATIISDITKFQ